MSQATYLTVEQLENLWRELNPAEEQRAEALIPIVEDTLRQRAKMAGKDLDLMIENGELLENVLISVVADIVARTLMTSTNSEPITQYSQSALGYSVSGTYLVPGGGIFIKNAELAKLGLRRQQIRKLQLFGDYEPDEV